ncbi:MAG: hypothetical protein IPI73_10220 [Betaproteobacteria bacterium]|nr:hypothetical protein [Betaproteobacteria bacterium]
MPELDRFLALRRLERLQCGALRGTCGKEVRIGADGIETADRSRSGRRVGGIQPGAEAAAGPRPARPGAAAVDTHCFARVGGDEIVPQVQIEEFDRLGVRGSCCRDLRRGSKGEQYLAKFHVLTPVNSMDG